MRSEERVTVQGLSRNNNQTECHTGRVDPPAFERLGQNFLRAFVQSKFFSGAFGPSSLDQKLSTTGGRGGGGWTSHP